ncbi:MAG: hypothetical protein JNM14_06330 [Ferruginibacter sp.]|nr:hypothetical protein [Ferruginibacter sp.]
MSLIVILLDLVKHKSDISQSMSIIVNDNATSGAVYSYLILFFFLPIAIYFLKLSFSLASIEHNKMQFDKYLSKLNTFFFYLENFFRFAIYLTLLMLLANLTNWIPKFLNLLSFDSIVGYGVAFDTANNYMIPIKGFPSLVNIICFNVFFFFLLLLWDCIVLVGNKLAGNSLPIKDFFLRFIQHHLIGFILWLILLFVLLTNRGYLLLRERHSIFGILLGVLLVYYLTSLVRSIYNLKSDLRLAIIED